MPSTKLTKERKEIYKKAWIEVKEKRLTVHTAAKLYGLSKTTLTKWCRLDDLDDCVPHVGRPCYLGGQLEKVLEKFAVESAQLGNSKLFKDFLFSLQNRSFCLGFPITPAKLIAEARSYNTKHGINDGWQPGYKWYKGFIRRQSISLRTPQSLSREKRNIKEPDIRLWFDEVK